MWAASSESFDTELARLIDRSANPPHHVPSALLCWPPGRLQLACVVRTTARTRTRFPRECLLSGLWLAGHGTRPAHSYASSRDVVTAAGEFGPALTRSVKPADR